MSGIRKPAAAVLLAFVLLFALSTPGSAQRDAESAAGAVHEPAAGSGLLGDALDWGQQALHWLQSLFDEEHGEIVPKP